MSLARAAFVERAGKLIVASQRDDIISKPPSELDWNEHARLTRCSISLSAFICLEEFVQRRVEELVAKLSGVSSASPSIPKEMRIALSRGVLDSVAKRIKDPSRYGIGDIDSYAVQHARQISSIGGGVVDPSILTLANNNSNLSWDTIDAALRAFAVDNPASAFNGVAKRIAGGIFVAKDYLEGVLRQRHKIAHVVDTDMPHSDMTQQLDQLVLFCSAFDLVASTGLRRLLSGVYRIPLNNPLKSADVDFRVIDLKGNKWRERAEVSTKANSSHLSRTDALAAAEAIARPKGQCVVVLSGAVGTLPADWSTPFL